MAENEQLLIEISGETTALVRSLADAKNQLSAFGEQGTISINSLNDALSKLASAANKAVDISRIKEFGDAYRNTEAVAQRLRNVFQGLSDDGVTFRNTIAGQNAQLEEFRRLASFEPDSSKIRELGKQMAITEQRIEALNNALEEGRIEAEQNAGSIQSLSRRLVELRRAADQSTDPVAIKQFGVEARKLQGEIDVLRGAFNGLDNSTRRSRIAVFGLNQVVRDLPFGFIAISNNIPVLIDQFVALRAENKSTAAALREFGRGLISIGGLSVAISAAISLVTYAVQQYGSLSNAVDILFNNLTAAERVQLDFNKAIAEGQGDIDKQIVRLDLLQSLSNNATIGIENQKYATQLLRDEVDKIIVSQDLQKESVERVTGELLDYAKKVVIARAQLAGFDKVIGDLGVEFAKASFEGVSFADNVIGGLNKINTFLLAVRDGQFALAAEIAKTDFAVLAYKRYQDRLEAITKRQKDAITAQEKFTNATIQSGIKAIDLFNQQLELKKKEEKERKDAERDAELARKKALRDQEKLNKEIRKSTEEFALFRALLDQPIPIIPVSGVELFTANLIEAKKRLLELGNTAIPGTFAAPFAKILGDIDRLKRINQQNLFDISAPQIDNSAIKNAQDQVNRFIKSNDVASKKILDTYNDQVSLITGLFNQTLGPAIDGVFSALVSGENILENLGNAFKRLAVDIAATVVKTLLLKAILSAINPAAGIFSSVGGGAGGLAQAIFGAFGARSAAAPVGGIGSQITGPGGFGLSGQVVFVQRGSDLVGVLNQTSARIGRIG